MTTPSENTHQEGVSSPRVHIFIPTYQNQETLSETLDSLLAQSFTDFEITIVDNASTDRTMEIAQIYTQKDKRISIYQHKQNSGPEKNFEFCISQADREYTAIFHSDDIYAQDILKEQVNTLDKNPDMSAVSTHALRINMENKVLGERYVPPSLRTNTLSSLSFPELLNLVFSFGNFITCPSVMARSDLFRDKIKSWNSELFASSADLDVWLRLSRLGRFGFIHKPMMCYRESEHSFSERIKNHRIYEHHIFRVLDYYANNPETSVYLNPQAKSSLTFLRVKDTTARSINLIREFFFSPTNKTQQLPSSTFTLPPLPAKWFSSISHAFDTAYHFKFFVVILLFLILRPIVVMAFYFKRKF